jgi:hypothetical protein
MKGQYTAAVLLLTAFLFGCGDNAGSPTGYSPAGTDDGALLMSALIGGYVPRRG